MKVCDSGAGVGVADITGVRMYVADGFSVSDNAGGTGTLNIGGSAVVVSGNSAGLGGVGGSIAGGYISVSNRGGNGTLTVSGGGALYGRYLEYNGNSASTVLITVGGTGGKLVISEELVVRTPGRGQRRQCAGQQPGSARRDAGAAVGHICSR